MLYFTFYEKNLCSDLNLLCFVHIWTSIPVVHFFYYKLRKINPLSANPEHGQTQSDNSSTFAK